MPALPGFAPRLKSALVHGFKAVDISVTVGFKVLGKSRVCRVYVVSDDFDDWRYQERQEFAWRIVNAELTNSSDRNRISMIVTATKEEVEDDEESPVPRRSHRSTRRRRGVHK